MAVVVAIAEADDWGAEHGLALRVLGEPGPRTWSKLGLDLESGAVAGAAVVDELSSEVLSFITAFPGRLVVMRSEDQLVQVLAELGWTHVEPVEMFFVLAPPAATAREVSHEEFGDAVEGSEPVWTEVDPRELALSDERLFGVFASTRLGGSSALLALSGFESPEEPVELRNPAALGLERVDRDHQSLTALMQAGKLRLSALGVSGPEHVERIDGFEDREAMAHLWSSRARDDHPFWLLIELASPSIDPPVWMPAGQIFEQRALNGRQTLATTTGVGTVASPGRLTTLLLPAYCLDRQLGSPAGDPMAATPLRAPLPPGATQRQVWSQREAARRGGR